MRLTGSGVYISPVPKMPQGLVQLMEGLTRDVLKNKPTDLNEFCAEHMRKLLEIRDGPSPSKPIQLKTKISKALDKIKERAEKRRAVYNLENKQTKSFSEVDEPKHEKMQIEPLMGDILKAPIHHETELSDDLEVEIFHEPVKIGPTIVEEQEEGDENILESEDNLNSPKANELREITPVDVQSNAESIVNKQDKEKGFREKESIHENSKEPESMKENKYLRKEEDSTHKGVDSKDIPFANQVNSQINSPVFNCEGIEITRDDNILNNSATNRISNEIAETETSSKTSESVQQICKNLATNCIKDESKKYIENITTAVADNPADIFQDNNENGKVGEITALTSEYDLENEENNSLSADVPDKDASYSLNETDHKIKNKTEEEPKGLKDLNKNAHHHVDTVENTNPNVAAEIEYKGNDIKSSKMNFQNDIERNYSPSDKEVIDPSNETTPTAKCSSPEEITSEDSIEEININRITRESSPTTTTTMDLETAAVTIQKVFRTFMFKSRASTDDKVHDEAISFDEDDANKDEMEFQSTSPNLNKDRRTLALIRMDTVLQTVNEEKSLSLSTDDSSLSSAATVIQAHVRGFLVRNKFNMNKTMSSSSLANSDRSTTSLEAETDPQKKTVLNIHIVPDGEHYVFRDESLLTSMDLSLDGSPPNSSNLHPMMSFDVCERRKQLKREDAIQSVSPPSNNSGKLSEDVDSIKELPIMDNDTVNNQNKENIDVKENSTLDVELESNSMSPSKSTIIETVVEARKELSIPEEQNNSNNIETKVNCDETDVVTPNIDKHSSTHSDFTSQLLHSGEFHDIVLPTKVFRSDTSVVRGE